jgi:hypothetical protein
MGIAVPNNDLSYAERSIRGKHTYSAPIFKGVVQEMFPSAYELLPQIRQVYELDLAYGEWQKLTKQDLIHRGAYFRSIDGVLTNHYQICVNTPDQVNATAKQERKNFFAANVFAVGYATHGLFPYRGKFHPQMIKAVMNVMGLRPGDTVLDPMAGCGTTCIEASVMGIDSIGYELSPFACLMTRAKAGVLVSRKLPEVQYMDMADDIFDRLAAKHPAEEGEPSLFSSLFATQPVRGRSPRKTGSDRAIEELILLCYLDAVGYASRRKGKTARNLFPALLSRYIAAVNAFIESRESLCLTMGACKVMEGDARRLRIGDRSVDGILFSPPYSFAIDYVENDRPQLTYLGVDIGELKRSMVGLRGSGRTRQELLEDRVQSYFADMELVLRECVRVLKPGCPCVVIIGSNTNQTGGVSLEEGLVRIAARLGLPLEHQVMRQIEGIHNTMRDEFILFFRKPSDPTKGGRAS